MERHAGPLDGKVQIGGGWILVTSYCITSTSPASLLESLVKDPSLVPESKGHQPTNSAATNATTQHKHWCNHNIHKYSNKQKQQWQQEPRQQTDNSNSSCYYYFYSSTYDLCCCYYCWLLLLLPPPTTIAATTTATATATTTTLLLTPYYFAVVV